MVNSEHRFHLTDYVIFGVTLVISLGIGFYYAFTGGKQRTTSEYFVGNRRMAIIPVAVSLLVSFESSIMMLGLPAEVYVFGLQILIADIGFLCANFLSLIVALPLIHPLKITSVYEYLELRFDSHAVRMLGTILGILGMICYMGIVLFGPAIALEAVTGFPLWYSILYVGGASIVYTAVGGFKAVIWTDVFQCAIMLSGMLALLILGTKQIGGVKETWKIADEGGRINLFNFDPDPTVRHTFWNLLVGSFIRGFAFIFNQGATQRISSTPTLRDARRMLLYATPGFLIFDIFAMIQGIISYSYYHILGCDPFKSGQLTDTNQIIPYMVMDIFQDLHGLPGLYMAALFSASLSTLSSGLSSLSALFWTDLVRPHVKPISEFKATVISKLAVVAFGGLAIFMAFMISLVGGTLIQIAGSVLSSFGGPLAGLFLFAAFCPWGNKYGALFGTILSAVVAFIIASGQMSTKGSVRYLRLPSNPITSCPVQNTSGAWSIWNDTSTPYDTFATSSIFNDTYDINTEPGNALADAAELTGFQRLFMLSYQWFGPVAILNVIIFGTIISFITGRTKPGKVDPMYLISFCDSMFPFLPECILKPLRCGYDLRKPKECNVVKAGLLYEETIVIEDARNIQPNSNDILLSNPNDTEIASKVTCPNNKY